MGKIQMKSRRMLKKKINDTVNNIIEECYSVQMSNKDKHTETNKIIDETVALFDDLLSRVHAASSIEDAKKLKKHYESIHQDLEKKSLALMTKLNKV